MSCMCGDSECPSCGLAQGTLTRGADDLRYVLYPGRVQSAHDSDAHYLSAERLAALYGVRMQDCAVADASKPDYLAYRPLPGDIALYPRTDGKYEGKALEFWNRRVDQWNRRADQQEQPHD